MLILVYFQGRPTHMVYFHGRPTHTCSSWSIFKGDRPTWSIFMGDLPFHSHYSIFTSDLPTHAHPGLFSGATCPHFILVYFQGRPAHMVYFHGRPALSLTLIYFHGRPTHTCSSWSIFRGDRPTHSHGLFSWATCPYTHIGFFFLSFFLFLKIS